MRKLTKGLLIAAIIFIVGWLCVSTAYTYTVSEEVTRLRREGRSDLIYLRTRVRELESELTSILLNSTYDPMESVDGTPETESETTHDTAPDTEAVTVPSHQSPETQAPADTLPETESPVALYLLTEHDGLIGIFDSSGELVRTLNVFVFTLPEAERAALQVGIPAYSHEEMLRLAAQYE